MTYSPERLQHYQILYDAAGFVHLPSQAWIQLTGVDCNKFLHNFCTADIKSMSDGHVNEAFFLDSRGKTIAFGHVVRGSGDVWISTAASHLTDKLCGHLQKYIILEDVVVADRSEEFGNVFVTGAESVERLSSVAELEANMAHETEIGGTAVVAANTELAGWGYLIRAPRNSLDTVYAALEDQGITACSYEALQMKRIEQGSPWHGVEIDDSNLPQELRRDAKAISFTKGCYLGQETVAKIDAFGHVNRFLVGLQLASNPGEQSMLPISHDGAKIGMLKANAYSPRLNSWLATGYVKSRFANVGSHVHVGEIPAQVVELPLRENQQETATNSDGRS